MMIFSHTFLDSDCINFKTCISGCLLIHLKIIIQHTHQSSTIFLKLTKHCRLLNSSTICFRAFITAHPPRPFPPPPPLEYFKHVLDASYTPSSKHICFNLYWLTPYLLLTFQSVPSVVVFSITISWNLLIFCDIAFHGTLVISQCWLGPSLRFCEVYFCLLKQMQAFTLHTRQCTKEYKVQVHV